MQSITNVTLVGVGGQGILLTSDILARAAALSGFDVKKSEIHGMSQRGGSVSSQVRFGRAVHSPIIPDAESDVLVAFELLEAIRCFPMLRPEGKAIVDRRDIVPLTVSSGMQPGVEDRDGLVAKLYGDRARIVRRLADRHRDRQRAHGEPRAGRRALAPDAVRGRRVARRHARPHQGVAPRDQPAGLRRRARHAPIRQPEEPPGFIECRAVACCAKRLPAPKEIISGSLDLDRLFSMPADDGLKHLQTDGL